MVESSDQSIAESLDGDAVRYRRAVARAVSASWSTIPHFAVSRDVGVEGLLAERQKFSSSGARLTLSGLLVRALAVTAPRFLSQRGIELATRMAEETRSDIGLAVATQKGVAIPVVPNVLELEPARLAQSCDEAIARARTGRSAPADAFAPLTVLSNLGSYGVDSFTAVVPSNATSIVSVGRIRDHCFIGQDGVLGTNPMMSITINADHRVLDGVDAAEWLDGLASLLGDGHFFTEGS